MKGALSLGYLGSAEGINAWYRFAVDICRLQAIRDGEALRLRVADRAWHLGVDPSVPGADRYREWGSKASGCCDVGVALLCVPLRQHANDSVTSLYAR